MTVLSKTLPVLCLLALGTASACQTTDVLMPAVLEVADDDTMAMLKQVLAGAMDRASVDIGPGDLTQNSVISVLPPGLTPLEGRSTALPVQFDLMLDAGGCYLVRRETSQTYPVDGLTCRVAQQ